MMQLREPSFWNHLGGDIRRFCLLNFDLKHVHLLYFVLTLVLKSFKLLERFDFLRKDGRKRTILILD